MECSVWAKRSVLPPEEVERQLVQLMRGCPILAAYGAVRAGCVAAVATGSGASRPALPPALGRDACRLVNSAPTSPAALR